MEKMGGGIRTSAGAQLLRTVHWKKALNKSKQILTKMKEEGDI